MKWGSGPGGCWLLGVVLLVPVFWTAVLWWLL